jgi:ferredoxin
MSAASTGRRTPGTGAATLHIDWTLCDGRGLCTELLPELLERDEWGYPLARRGDASSRSDVVVPVRLTEAARDAVAMCPRAALRLRGGS